MAEKIGAGHGLTTVAMELAFLYVEHGGYVNIALSLARMVKHKIPDFPPAAGLLGWAYYKSGSANYALPQREQCVRKVPGQSVCQYHLGMPYMTAGRSKSCGSGAFDVLWIDPTLAYAQTAKAALGQFSKFCR